jgi:hypothetical protein
MLGNLDIASQNDAQSRSHLADLGQRLPFAVRPDLTEAADPLNLKRLQNGKHLVASSLDDRTCRHNYALPSARSAAFPVSTVAMPRSRRPSRSDPVIMLRCEPQTRIKSLSMTSSPGRSGTTFRCPMTSPSRVCMSRTINGRCQHTPSILSDCLNKSVTQEMVGIQHEGGLTARIGDDDPLLA